MEEQKQSFFGLFVGFGVLIVLVIYLSISGHLTEAPPAEVVAETAPVPEEAPQAPRQWTAPMQRWLESGNRLVVDFVHEDGWCAVAIRRPPTEEGAEPSVQCIK